MTDQQLVKWLKENAEKKVWCAATVNSKGQYENVVQAYVKTKGARKGEANFKKQQMRARKGTYRTGTDLGTCVMNIHKEKQILDTTDIDIDAIPLSFGRMVKIRKVFAPHDAQGHDQIFAEACKRAAAKLEEMNAAKTSQAADSIVQSAAGTATLLVAREGLQA